MVPALRVFYTVVEMVRARCYGSSELRYVNQTWGQEGFLEDMTLSGLTLSHECEQVARKLRKELSQEHPHTDTTSSFQKLSFRTFYFNHCLTIHLSKFNCELLVGPRMSGSYL